MKSVSYKVLNQVSAQVLDQVHPVLDQVLNQVEDQP